ncbi:MAG: CRISPR-associated endonuclease Cas2 [Phycisphaeraceae bacterium]|nr:CRISPR-associated endonuclease Cas2 [Phycisphaeraceae bacterium]
MYVLITYDVCTTDDAGKRRLRRIARACEDYGQRVQNSVFECSVDPAQFAALKHRLLELIDPTSDSVRFYFLGKSWLKDRRVEHHGSKPSFDIDGPLMI